MPVTFPENVEVPLWVMRKVFPAATAILEPVKPLIINVMSPVDVLVVVNAPVNVRAPA